MKSFFCSLRLRNFIVILISSSLLLQPLSNKALAGYFNQVIVWTSECFKTKSLSACETALRVVNDFQLLASSNDNYRCQTSLLGLEANLIMIILKSSNSKRVYVKALDDVKRDCDNVMHL